MTITSHQRESSYVVDTYRGGIMPRAHTIATALGVLAVALVAAAGIVSLIEVRHLAVVLIVGGAVTAALAGMVATHHRPKK